MEKILLAFIITSQFASIIYVKWLGKQNCHKEKVFHETLIVSYLKDWIITPLALLGAMSYLCSYRSDLWMTYTFPLPYFIKVAGFLSTMCGTIMKFWAYKHLGSNWSAITSVYEGQKIIHSGPYRVFRHPVYLSYQLVFIGFAVYTTNLIWLSLAIVYTLLNQLRAWQEEDILAKQENLEYREYHRNTRNNLWLLLSVIVIIANLIGMTMELIYLLRPLWL